jgi:hypothetical protein
MAAHGVRERFKLSPVTATTPADDEIIRKLNEVLEVIDQQSLQIHNLENELADLRRAPPQDLR